MTHKILIVDDDLSVQYALKRIIENHGHDVISACTLEEGFAHAQVYSFSVVLLDIGLPDGNGMDAIGNFSQSPGHPEIIIITGLGTEDDVSRALASGAYDYISKHAPMEEVIATLDQALSLWESTTHDSHGSPGPQGKRFSRDRLCGSSAPFMRSLALAEQYARVDSNVLILGETGTGKELFARTIHDNSARKSSPFVTVDCASLPDSLAQSILFGHVKGAFTSADVPQRGLVAEAEQGTLFFDEIGELPLDVQKIFLRVLQEKTYRLVGSTREIACDFRLIAATNRNLLQMVEDGKFRKDLYFRLQTCILELVPLRQRKEDIEELVAFFIERFCDFYRQPLRSCTPVFMQALTSYPWPGNVRELMHAIEYALSASRSSDPLSVHHLPGKIRVHGVKQKFVKNITMRHKTTSNRSCADRNLLQKNNFPEFAEYRKNVLYQAEKNYMHQLSSLANKNIQYMMHLSGLSKSRCYALMKKYLS
ncbi:sigma-54-dependent transcriptional regulator [Desulfoplanes formicivorans]|uniref:Fis family transcriptional regulator n=1 Tax=Desulfoplanes formicivorans TaxID=1592317 RepID=A0A194AGF1_9BACT|nr:sigma-54 dependent transcriptional regulator [Desulfoplanes formicivorans]GAU08161.1 Fis family transcriptional regulator [Desulfoplanes formicivorans]